MGFSSCQCQQVASGQSQSSDGFLSVVGWNSAYLCPLTQAQVQLGRSGPCMSFKACLPVCRSSPGSGLSSVGVWQWHDGPRPSLVQAPMPVSEADCAGAKCRQVTTNGQSQSGAEPEIQKGGGLPVGGVSPGSSLSFSTSLLVTEWTWATLGLGFCAGPRRESEPHLSSCSGLRVSRGSPGHLSLSLCSCLQLAGWAHT